MTDTTTTEDRIVVLPEITIPASARSTAAEILALLEELRPQLEHLHTMALSVREEYHRALVALGKHMDLRTDTAHELAADAVGWTPVWEAISAVVPVRYWRRQAMEPSRFGPWLSSVLKRGPSRPPKAPSAVVRVSHGQASCS